jgi:hypothetical protein
MNLKPIAAVVLLGAPLGIWTAIGRGGDRDKATAAPEFAGVTEWLNSKPLKLADQKGKVVIVHFWTNGWINCIHNYPHYRAWQEKFKDSKNLVIVGVHTPEFEAEKGSTYQSSLGQILGLTIGSFCKNRVRVGE